MQNNGKIAAYGGRLKSSRSGNSFDYDQMYTVMQKGHSVRGIWILFRLLVITEYYEIASSGSEAFPTQEDG